jgi:mono/diheme cytochrome c family protein
LNGTAVNRAKGGRQQESSARQRACALSEGAVNKKIWVSLACVASVTGVAAAFAAPLGTVTAPQTTEVQLAQAAAPVDTATLQREGQMVFNRDCFECHGRNGEGSNGIKLQGYANLRSAPQVINQILSGSQYMPPFGEALNDRQVAAVATYIRTNFGNSFGPVQPSEVASVRAPAAR